MFESCYRVPSLKFIIYMSLYKVGPWDFNFRPIVPGPEGRSEIIWATLGFLISDSRFYGLQ